jgi:NMD protein affecting ribosome stability and mRNA decay
MAKKIHKPVCPDCGETVTESGLCYECQVELRLSHRKIDKYLSKYASLD